MPAYKTLIIKIDYEELKPETYRGVIALTEDAIEILRINTKDMEADYTKDMEADYEAVKRALAGTCEACVDDSTVMNFRILQDVPPHTN
jgi:translation initiation factor 2B subunit (eIF-2B alpha/beta/delta family)